MADITNKEIFEKLVHIEKLLSDEKEEEEKIVTEESKIIQEEEKIKEMVTKKDNKKFADVMSWKIFIWENCHYKKHDLITSTKIGFVCTLTKKACDFIDCPENISGSKK